MTAFTRDWIEQSLPDRFEAQAACTPNVSALRDAGRSWSYAALNRWANRLAREYLPANTGMSGPVALLIGHGALEIAALLAVLKRGRAYVALDPRTPVPRLRQIAADIDADCI